MLDTNVYKEKVKEIAESFMQLEGLSLLDMLNINAEIVTAFTARHFADKGVDAEEISKEVVEFNNSILTHHLSFLKSDMEKYTC